MKSVSERNNRRLRILYLFANHGPLNKYKAWNELSRDGLETEPTFRQTLSELFEEDFIQLHHTDPRPTGGKPSDYYDLTLRGLSSLIASYDELPAKTSDPRQLAADFASKYHDLLPEVFGLWPSLVEEKVDDLAWNRLKFACGDLGFLRITGQSNADRVTSVFMDYKLELPGSLRKEDADDTRWLEAFRRNSILRLALAQRIIKEGSEYVGEANERLELLGEAGLKLLTPEESKKEQEAMQKLEERMRNIERVLERLEQNAGIKAEHGKS